jgi:hypothetical protein
VILGEIKGLISNVLYVTLDGVADFSGRFGTRIPQSFCGIRSKLFSHNTLQCAASITSSFLNGRSLAAQEKEQSCGPGDAHLQTNRQPNEERPP